MNTLIRDGICLCLCDLESLFGWLLAASGQASVLALLVLGLQWMLRARLNPRWRYALWLLVLARLVLPALPESALSLFQFAPPPPVSFTVPISEPLFAPATLPSPQVDLPFAEPSHPFSAFSLLAIVWMLGAAILLILTWQVNRRFARQVANSPEITDPEVLESFAAAKRELNIRRAIRLIESGQVQSPAIMGLFQPTLLLPADVRDKFDARELRFIFLHELAHLKRGDVIAQGLIALLQILHWFNPVLWFAFRRMRIDREPATDALVLSRTGEEEKERYGLMLIKLLEHFNQRHSLPTLVGILEDKDQFKRRFSLIARFTRGAYGWSLLGVLLIGVLAVACLTKSKTLISHSGTQKQMLEAVQKGDAATLQKLLAQGMDPKTIKSGYPTLLFEAGSPEVAEILIAHGVNVNAHDANEDTLVHLCSSGLSPSGEKNRAAIIRVLLKHGANPNAQDSLGCTPIVFARDGATVDALVEFGAKVNIQTKDGRDLMDFDHSSADLSYFQALERHGYSFAPDAHGSQLLVAASHTQNLEVMKWLLDRGVDPNTKGIWVKNTKTTSGHAGTFYDLPLQTAAIFGNTEAVRLLISRGAKADEPMITALHNGYGKIVKLFWESGVRNISELCYAVSQGAPVGDLQKLLDQGIPADPPQDKLITPLGVAAMMGNMDAVKLLVARNANVNAGQPINPKLPQYYRMSPLIMASGEGRDEIVDYLLQHGATPDPAALLEAAENSHPYPSQRSKDHFERTVRILIDAGTLKTATPELAGMILTAPLGTRNPGDNATVLKMLLDAGLSPELPLTDDVGKQTSVIDYYRDWCIKNKDNSTDIKPLLDMLEAADKGAGTKSSGAAPPSVAPTLPNDAAAVQAVKPDQEPDALHFPAMTPLDKAILADRYEEEKALLDQNAPFDNLYVAMALLERHNRTVKLLWDHGGRPCSELSYAISQGAGASEVETLLKNGTPVEPPEDKFTTPLTVATANINFPVMKALVEHGADPNHGGVMSPLGDSPLEKAAGTGRADLVAYLLQHGARPDPVAMQIAMCMRGGDEGKKHAEGYRTIISQLIDAGALNHLSEVETARLLISASGNAQDPVMLRQLLDHGLSPEARSDDPQFHGKTALESVRQWYDLRDTEPYNAGIKPLLNMLEAADKGAGTKPSGAAATSVALAPPNDEANDRAALKKDLLMAREDADARRVLLDRVKDLPDDQLVSTLQGLGRADANITALQTDIADKKGDIENLLTDGFVESHPRIQAMRAELVTKQRQLKELVAGMRRALTVDLQMADSRVALLTKEVAGASPSGTPAAVTAPPAPSGDGQELDDLKQKLLQAKEDANARLVLLDSVKNLPDDQFLATLAALGRSDPTITALQKEIADKNADMENLLKDGFAENHPRIRAMRTELAALQQESKRFTDGLHSAMAIDNQMAASRVALLQKEVDGAKAQTPPPSGTSR